MSRSMAVTSKTSAFARPRRITSRGGSHYRSVQRPKLLPSLRASDLMSVPDCFRIPGSNVPLRNHV